VKEKQLFVPLFDSIKLFELSRTFFDVIPKKGTNAGKLLQSKNQTNEMLKQMTKVFKKFLLDFLVQKMDLNLYSSRLETRINGPPDPDLTCKNRIHYNEV
jgi:hypothetical protein